MTVADNSTLSRELNHISMCSSLRVPQVVFPSILHGGLVYTMCWYQVNQQLDFGQLGEVLFTKIRFLNLLYRFLFLFNKILQWGLPLLYFPFKKKR
jgi:hypothetical protein